MCVLQGQCASASVGECELAQHLAHARTYLVGPGILFALFCLQNDQNESASSGDNDRATADSSSEADTSPGTLVKRRGYVFRTPLHL